MIPDPESIYTWDDFVSWEEEDRWELIGGKPFRMSSPTVLHQAICGELFGQLFAHFRGRPCRVFVSPLLVKLSEQDGAQPDIFVVCRPEMIRPGYIDGPPDLVIEIGSPSTVRMDRLKKLNLYACADVKEYWLVTPQPFLLEVLTNQGSSGAGRFLIAGGYTEMDTVVSPLFPDLKLHLSQMDLPFPEEVKEVVIPYGHAAQAMGLIGSSM
jgi:Uma2 family endonuclease